MKVLLVIFVFIILYICGGFLLEYLGMEGNAYYSSYGLIMGVIYSCALDIASEES